MECDTPLPNGYTWSTINLDDKELDEVYNLLFQHYVEDNDQRFRFNYSKEFLVWALKPPGYVKDWHVGVRGNNGKLYGFITGIPVHVHIEDSDMMMAEINFLCVHRYLRSKRLAPVLIKEITRRINLSNIWQAVYTAGVKLKNPIITSQYWHRGLQIKKLLDIGFMNLGPRMTLQRTIKLNKLPETQKLPGLRLMKKEDIPQVCKLLNSYLKLKTKLWIEWDEIEISHWLLPIRGVISSYVVEDKGIIKAFLSYYHLESSILNNPKHNKLVCAYSFYNVVTDNIKLDDLISDALICAYNEGYDVLNCLNIMENISFLKSLKFNEGNGNLHYYLYNWITPILNPNEVGIVLL